MFDSKKIQDIQNQTKELCSILSSMHPVETLKRAYWDYVCVHLGIETESQLGIEQTNSRFLIEYLQSLFISIDLKEELKMPTDKKEWQEIKTMIEKISEPCFDLFPIIDQNEDNQWLQENQALVSKVLGAWSHIRGDRYMIHEFEHIEELLKPHNEILKTLYKISVCDIVEGFKKICSAFAFAPQNLRESYKAKKEFQSFYNNLVKKKLPEKEVIKRLQDKIIELKLNKKIVLEDLDIQAITGWPEQFIKKFSATPGSNKIFLINGKYSGTPFQRLPIFRKPFLEYNSRFHLFNLDALRDNFYRNIQSAILEDKPDYLNKWKKIQSLPTP